MKLNGFLPLKMVIYTFETLYYIIIAKGKIQKKKCIWIHISTLKTLINYYYYYYSCKYIAVTEHHVIFIQIATGLLDAGSAYRY